MEPFSSTTIGSEIVYQCLPGFLPEGRMTSVCGEDGRWNPDPQGLCIGNLFCLSFHPFDLTSYTLVSDKTLSTTATAAITTIISSLVTFIAGTVCGVLLTVCISRWNKKRLISKPTPNTEEQQQTAVVYEEADIQNTKIELEENVAYGPVKQDQKFELKENVAYAPVKLNQ